MNIKTPTPAARMVALERDVSGMHEKLDEMREKLDEMHDALMKRQPGEEHSLLERMVIVTRGVESGRTVGHVLVWLAGVLAALAAIVAALKLDIWRQS